MDQRVTRSAARRNASNKKRASRKNPENDQGKNEHQAKKQRRITRSQTRKFRNAIIAEKFEQISGLLIASGYLRWHESLKVSTLSKSCQAVWKEQRDSLEGWKILLEELNMINCTNRCPSCEQVVLLKSNRRCCTNEQWQIHSADRTPDFEGVIDLVMATGVLTWREKGGVRRISKTCYKIYKELCTCLQEERTDLMMPFIKHDPRFKTGYKHWTLYKQVREMVSYTSWLVNNLLSFYDIARVTDQEALPYGLGGWTWFDLQMVTLQRGCPKRYTMVMNMVSLYLAQGELRRSPPYWYASAFLGQRHDPVTGSSYEECLGTGISEFCLPATDEILCRFLRDKCYPSREAQNILGPLIHKISLFAPFFNMVPPVGPNGAASSPSAATAALTAAPSSMGTMDLTDLRLPPDLEVLSDEMTDSMSFHFFCTIS